MCVCVCVRVPIDNRFISLTYDTYIIARFVVECLLLSICRSTLVTRPVMTPGLPGLSRCSHGVAVTRVSGHPCDCYRPVRRWPGLILLSARQARAAAAIIE